MSVVHCCNCHMQVYQLHAKLRNTDDADGEHHELCVENAVHGQTIFFFFLRLTIYLTSIE